MKVRSDVFAGMLIVALCSSLLSAMAAEDIFRPGEFFVGCNYWGSKAGIHMWRAQDWDAAEIKKDLAALAATGVEVMRVFPTWSEFQPIIEYRCGTGNTRGYLYEGSETPIRNLGGLDEAAMARFRFFCDEAQRNNIKLMVSLVTGWMSGRLFYPRVLEGKDLLTDSDALMWEGRFVRAFVRETKGHPAIVAWDLGNECNNMGKVQRPSEAWNWLNTIVMAIRVEDPSRPVISGMHGIQSSALATWNLQMQGELMDYLTPHPYPAPFRVDANRGPFNGFRNALHPVGQCLFYEGVGRKRAFPQEVGSLGPIMSPGWMAAKGYRQDMFSSWMHGLAGFLWWCAFEQTHLAYPPFENNAIERELGMLNADANRTSKPLAAALKEFKAFKDALPFKSLPPRKTDAVCLLSEYEDAWQTSFGALMLAKQAGFDIAFTGAESGPLDDAPLYILPSGTSWETYTHGTWRRVLAKVADGATLLVSRGGSTGYTDWLEVTGLEQLLYRQSHDIDFTFDGVELRASDTFNVIQTPKDCEVVAKDTSGNVVVAWRRYGKGQVIAVNFALELLSMTTLPNVFEGDFSNELWRIYAFAAKKAGVMRLVTREDTGLVVTEHPAENGKTLVCVLNTHDKPVSAKIGVKGSVCRIWNGTYADGTLSIRENDGCIFEVKE